MDASGWKICFVLLAVCVYGCRADDLCEQQVFLKSWNSVVVGSKPPGLEACNRIQLDENHKPNVNIGDLRLTGLLKDRRNFTLNITFEDVKWNKAYLKLYEEDKAETGLCRVYSTGEKVNETVFDVTDSCFNMEKYKPGITYALEFRAEKKPAIQYKKYFFALPDMNKFSNNLTSLPGQALFMYVEVTETDLMILKIQSLPRKFRVKRYKVDIYKEGGTFTELQETISILAEDKPELELLYQKQGLDGSYYFQVSVDSKEVCHNGCFRSESARVKFRRKYPPLVLAIIAASFIIPLVLFVTHISSKSGISEDDQEAINSLYIVHGETPEKHLVAVKALELALQSVANVQIVPQIEHAVHIIYVSGTEVFEPDATMKKTIVAGLRRPVSQLNIFVVLFPYSTKETPLYLRRCIKFRMVEDFGKLVRRLSNCEAQFENHPYYMNLKDKIKDAVIDNESKMSVALDMPMIVVSQQGGGSQEKERDEEPEEKERDALL